MSDNLLAKLMAKKGSDDEMDPNYKSAKMGVLKQLHDEMSKLMAGDLGGLKKVTVAAPDKQGLQEGLSKAQELMGHGVNLDDDSNPETQDDDHEHEADDSHMMSHGGAIPVNADEDALSEEDALVHNPDLHHDDGESDDEELEAKIKMLQEKLAKRKSK